MSLIESLNDNPSCMNLGTQVDVVREVFVSVEFSIICNLIGISSDKAALISLGYCFLLLDCSGDGFTVNRQVKVSSEKAALVYL